MILHKCDIICLSEVYLDSTTRIDDDKLQIPGYIFIRSVSIYHRSSLP